MAKNTVSVDQLCAFGIALTPRDRLAVIEKEQVAYCKFRLPLLLKNQTLGSYRLKHEVEAAVGTYISNGALIQAAIELGLYVNPDGRNARISG